jgi:hypothetical protein
VVWKGLTIVDDWPKKKITEPQFILALSIILLTLTTQKQLINTPPARPLGQTSSPHSPLLHPHGYGWVLHDKVAICGHQKPQCILYY